MTDVSQLSDAELFAALPKTPDTFSSQYGAAAQRAAEQLGVDPSLVLAQWGHETGWGKSIPGENNLGNIKGAGSAPVRDNMTGSMDSYQNFDSPEHFADQYASLILRKYPGAVGAQNASTFGGALKAGGYAEDPSYALRIAAAQKAIPKNPVPNPIPADSKDWGMGWGELAQRGLGIGNAQADTRGVGQMSNEELAAAAGVDLGQMSNEQLAAAAGVQLPQQQQVAQPATVASPQAAGGAITGRGMPTQPGTPEQVAPPQGSALDAFLTGAGDLVKGPQQLWSNTVAGAADLVAPNSGFAKDAAANAAATNQDMAAREKAYQASNPPTAAGVDLNRLAPQVLAAAVAPFKALPGVLAKIGQAGVGGAVSGALQPTATEGDYWSAKQGQVAGGTVAGAAGQGVLGAAGKVIAGKTLSPEVQMLVDRGITPLPGQAVGGMAKNIESKLTSVPVLGDAIARGEKANIKGFNTALYNEALKPLGEKMPDKAVGSDAVQHVHDVIGQAYKAIEPKAQFAADQPFLSDVQAIRSELSQKAPAMLDQFNTVLDQQVGQKMSHGLMDGEAWGSARSMIGGIARERRMGNSTADDRALAGALSDLNDSLTQGVTRNSGPEIAPALARANAAWAQYKQIENAAGSVGATRHDNVFTPEQLSTSVRRGSTNSQRATNSGVNADLANAGSQVLGNKYPDSGTAGRIALGSTGLLGGGYMVGHPMMAAAGAGLAGLYATEAGRKLMFSLLAKRPALAKALGGGGNFAPQIGLLAPRVSQ